MLELIAQGPTVDHRWRRPLPGVTIELGRWTDSFRVPWDNQVSRRHVRLTVGKNRLRVQKIEDASNPVFFKGTEVTDFFVRPGEHFVIGNTSFMLASDQAFGSATAPAPVQQRTFTADFLKQVQYRDANHRINVLNRIPDLIANAGNDDELLIGMINTLMLGISTARTIGVVKISDANVAPAFGAPPSNLKVIHWDRRGLTRGDFQPSEKLVAQAVEMQQTVLNVWQTDQPAANQGNFTFDLENDWAFACPMTTEATQDWAIYVAGSSRVEDTAGAPENADDMDGDIKFCELVGATLKNLLHVQQLERQQASLRSFFSPVVVEALQGRDPETVLQPRQCELSVLFCDLRGFSKTSEQLSDDLLELLSRVSDSLGVTTRMILETGGVIGDFHGDSVMGFWGWPLEAQQNLGSAAVAAATRIQAACRQQADRSPFTMGIGIASGTAVAGKIGTQDQVKVTAFGPVVNLASRLEGLTKRLNASVLIDGNTMWQTRPTMEPTRWRRLGNFLPFGMSNPVEIFQIFDGDSIASPATAAYQQGLLAFEAGDRQAAAQAVAGFRGEDSACEFLYEHLRSAASIESAVDDNDQGLIRLSSK